MTDTAFETTALFAPYGPTSMLPDPPVLAPLLAPVRRWGIRPGFAGRAASSLLALLFVLAINGLIGLGGGLAEAGLEGLTSSGYSGFRSVVALIAGIVMMAAPVVTLFVIARVAKRRSAAREVDQAAA
jgi:hypothetical protein